MSSRIGEGALVLLFPAGSRPDARVVRKAVDALARASVTHELPGEGGGPPVGLELLVDGLTFDLLGLAPGPTMAIPTVRHGFAVDDHLDTQSCEALALRPGPHIAAGARSLTILRAMAGLAAELVAHLDRCAALAWPPAATLVGPTFFRSTADAWIDGGPFPALGFTAFAPSADGGLRSDGLAWFTGQELALDPTMVEDRAAATRLGVRLVNQLVGRGRLSANELVVGPDGERLALEPDGDTIRVRRG